MMHVNFFKVLNYCTLIVSDGTADVVDVYLSVYM
jgi:hypothetical protein